MVQERGFINRNGVGNTVGISSDRANLDFNAGGDRRIEAMLVILLVWAIVSLLHWQPQTQWFMAGLTAILSVQTVRILTAKPIFTSIEPDGDLPKVSILVPAKNESAVLTDLVDNLFHLNYPTTDLDIWVIDDGSTDETPQILSKLQTQFPRLQVRRRESKGGKAGALNSVFPLTQGEIVLICDADAQLRADFLRQTVPLFQLRYCTILKNRQDACSTRDEFSRFTGILPVHKGLIENGAISQFQQRAIGAVQVRKSISNPNTNFLTRCQQMEMSCDAFVQTHRIAVAGMTELRGNGMLVRRELLEQFNGWNEDTVTDDLDLTFKLYLIGTEIEFVTAAAVEEEAVATWIDLWHQHCRWAEGGYQRYLDYFPQIFTLDWQKEIDLLLFLILQFLLPIALIPDLLWTVFYSHRPVLWPLQILFGFLLTVGFMAGVYEFQSLRGWRLIWATIQGSLYMVHWIPVMILVTFRMCVKQGRSQWVKTEHYGRSV